MTYQGIIERVRAATGADRDLAMDVASAVLGGEWRPYSGERRVKIKWLYSSDGRVLLYGHEQPESWFKSIDAALALAEKLLPGWWVRLLDEAMSDMVSQSFDGDSPFAADLKLLPKYIILATLLALQSQEPK